MALWLPKGDDVMAKIHTKTYLLDNDRRVTVKQVSDKVGISPSAARNRLDKHTDPDKIYAPYSSNGGLKKKKAKTIEKIRPYKDPMFILAMKAIGFQKK
jgi:predicted ArsR family transcriptional regulator